jgi:membrane protein DedA with SNARE-associated domain
VLTHRGEMSLPALLIFAWAGSVLGDNIGYLIGRTICRATITGYGGKIGLTDARISAAEEIFSRYGSATVLFARFFPVLRHWWRFLLFNAIGAALWVGAWVFIAVYFSAHAAATAQFANNLVFAAAALGLVILLVSLVVRRLRRDLG